jgi:hypothetical protein
MLVTDLPFPIVIVAPDGWAEFIENCDDVKSWNSIAVRKYSRIGFIVADASGSVWDLVNLALLGKTSLFDRFRLQPRRIPTEVHPKATVGCPLDVFCDRLRNALSADSDWMTQFCSKEKIRSVIDGADSVQGLSQNLRKSRVI